MIATPDTVYMGFGLEGITGAATRNDGDGRGRSTTCCADVNRNGAGPTGPAPRHQSSSLTTGDEVAQENITVARLRPLGHPLDDLDQFVSPVTAGAGELYELPRPRQNLALSRSAAYGDPAASAEFEQALLAK